MCSRGRLAYLSRLAIQGLPAQSKGSLSTRASNTFPGFHQQLRMKSTDSKGHSPGKTKTVVASGGALRFRGPPGTRGGISSRLSNKNLVSKPSKDAWKVVGYSMADSFDLVTLQQQIAQQGVYDVSFLHEELNQTCIYATATYDIDDPKPNSSSDEGRWGGFQGRPRREIFFFADGSVIFWSVPELEREMVLRFLRNPQIAVGHYDQDTVFEESELMTFKVNETNSNSYLDTKGIINFAITPSSGEEDSTKSRHYLEKFAFSNAMAASVKLGALETSLDKIIDSIEFLSEDMKEGRPFATSRKEVLKKSGELFALRHVLNLSSDLLDTPDFYWDRETLESMYLSTCSHLAIAKRIRITNEKISHCIELMDLVRNHLNDNHHTKLEWYIIILIMIEVGFEIIHMLQRFV